MMFICLLVTAIIAAAFGYSFQAMLIHSMVDNGEGVMVYSEGALYTLIGILITSAIALLVMSFVLPIMFSRGKHNILIPLIIYVCLMGILLSTFTFIFEPIILVESFAITSLIFGLMALLGYLSKGRLTGIGFILLGLLIGAGLLAGFNFLMIMFNGISEANVMLSWIVSFMLFGLLMLVTLYDVYRIKRIAEGGEKHDNNLVLYCAYILYSDFIALLVRVIYYVAIIFGKRK